MLTTEPPLQYPDFTKPFILTTDANNDAIGTILSQASIGRDPPIAYASRTLNNAERNYPMTGGCKYFRQYLYGKKFTTVTDHRPLTWIFSIKD
jgi:hypothetical protein